MSADGRERLPLLLQGRVSVREWDVAAVIPSYSVQMAKLSGRQGGQRAYLLPVAYPVAPRSLVCT